MDKIKRVSMCFRIFFQILIMTIPCILIFAWSTTPESIVIMDGWINMSFIPQAYMTAGSQHHVLHVLSHSEKILGFFISAIPMIINMYIVYLLIKLFKMYERSEIFSINNVRTISNIGYAMLLGQIIDPIYQALMGLVLTWHNPPGQRLMAVTLDQTNVGIVITALLVILISWIMAEGQHLREEQQLTI